MLFSNFVGDACTIELLEETSPPGYGSETSPKDNQSVDTKTINHKEQPETHSTSSGTEPPKKPSPAQAAMRKSSFRFDRWYKLTLK